MHGTSVFPPSPGGACAQVSVLHRTRAAYRCSEEERRQQRAGWLEDDDSPSTESGKRVALLFFGLMRSLPYTLPHIEKNVFQTLKDAGYRCFCPVLPSS